MANRADGILKSIIVTCGDDIYNDLILKAGIVGEKPAVAKQAKYIKSLLDELSLHYGNETAEKVMRPCGYQCISGKTIKAAKLLYEKADSIEEFLKLLNNDRIGGGYLHIEDDKIIGIYDRCYCGIAKSAKDISPAYCECSAGWFERLFSSVFGKQVVVKRVYTILDGADKCTFHISF